MAQLPDEPEFAREYKGDFTVPIDPSTRVRPLYMESSTGSMAEANADSALYVDGKIQIEGMPDDVKTTINKLEKRLDKLERFYEQVTLEAQEVVDASEAVENTDEWKERVLRIATDVGLRKSKEGQQDP